MVRRSSSNTKEMDDRRKVTEILPGCIQSDGSSFNEIMDREWEELVIRFDKETKDYVFRTACCKGAHVC